MGNREWVQRSLKTLWHPCSQMKIYESAPPIPVKTAQGVWLTDYEGNRYLDAISSWWVNLFGHGNSQIAEAITRQLHTLDHVMLAGCTHAPVVELSERLSKLTQGQLGHAFYGSDGASATEIALKMSAHYWRNQNQPQKNQFLCLKNGYHGETIGALGVTQVPLFREAYGPLIRPAFAIDAPDLRIPGSEAESLHRLEDHLCQHHSQIAALIVEPLIQAAAGMVFHSPSWLTHAFDLCQQYQVHFIADEIAVGFGRSGTFLAMEQAGRTPDFLCLSKGITGGLLPLSVVLTRSSIYQAFLHEDVAQAFLHSHSYTGNPLACAAALAVLGIFEEQKIIRHNQERIPVLEGIAHPLRQDPRVSHYRQLGMIWAFDVPSAPDGFAGRFHQAALKQGLLLRPIGSTVYFMPPYVISDEEFSFLVKGVLSALDEVCPK